MGSVVLAGATSGSTTLTPTDAVTATITLPSATCTLAGVGVNVGTPIIAYASADISFTNTANYIDVVSVAQGTVGTWFVSGTVTFTVGGVANIYAKLYDGTTVIACSAGTYASAGYNYTVSLSGYIVSPTGNLRIALRNITANSGNSVWNGSTLGKDCTITAFRIG